MCIDLPHPNVTKRSRHILTSSYHRVRPGNNDIPVEPTSRKSGELDLTSVQTATMCATSGDNVTGGPTNSVDDDIRLCPSTRTVRRREEPVGLFASHHPFQLDQGWKSPEDRCELQDVI